MPPSPEQPDQQSALVRTAQEHVDEILARRQEARAARAEALANLAARSELVTIRAQLVPPTPEGLAPENVALAPAVTLQSAGYLLAIGDSWFDYPVHDVLTNLHDHFAYNVESAAHKGDAIENMVSHVGQLDKFTRNLDKIVGLGATPKAVLLSGGGNDIAGTHFDLFLNNIDLQLSALNEQVVAGVIDTRLATVYRLMFFKINAICRDALGHTIPIVIHGYDHPVPDGRGFWGGWGPLPGPWLKPGFDQKLYTDLAANTTLIASLIDRFNAMLQTVAQEPASGQVHYVNLRGTLSNALADYEDYWANELHPTGGDPFFPKGNGFKLVAKRFADVLTQLP